VNILFIISDQHHPRMTGYRGHPHVQTPNLDRLAREGAHFTRAYCTNPICTPSRMSMITGQYTHRIGVPNNGFPLDRDIMTWPRRLDQAGVESTMLGKLDLCGEYQDAGFTHHRIIRRRPVHPAMSAEPPYHMTEPFRERLPGAFRSWRPVSRALRHAGPRTSQILCRDWFMIVHDNLKYTWYSDGEQPTLFDLASDPHELHDVAADPTYAAGLRACHDRLLTVCHPEAESLRAQAQLGLVGTEHLDRPAKGGP